MKLVSITQDDYDLLRKEVKSLEYTKKEVIFLKQELARMKLLAALFATATIFLGVSFFVSIS